VQGGGENGSGGSIAMRMPSREVMEMNRIGVIVAQVNERAKR
jgi:hypothetical protein